MTEEAEVPGGHPSAFVLEGETRERLPLGTRGESCQSCSLRGALGPVRGQKNPMAEVLFLGEAPGEQETIYGSPFIGASGGEFEKVLRRLGLERDQFAIANVLQCKPPSNDMTRAGNAVGKCHPRLSQFLELHPNVKTIIALGGTALNASVSNRGEGGILRYRGWWQHGVWGVPVMPTFHPSFLLPRKGQTSSTKWVGVVMRDVERALTERPGWGRKVSYALDPSPAESLLLAHQILQKRPSHLSTDIETTIKRSSKGDPDTLPDGGDILRISFGWGVGEAMSIPWHAAYMGTIQLLLGSDIPKDTWNGWNFDYRVLESAGRVIGGRLDDWMVAWHVLWPNLPKGLEFGSSFYCTHLQPWKHINHVDFARYSAIDADATWTTAEGIMRDLSCGDTNVIELSPLR